MLDTTPYLFPGTFPSISREKLKTLQINLGYLCNQQCQHCHVDAGPRRKEIMSSEVIDQIIMILKTGMIECIDLTGGAPEMNPEFRRLVSAARSLNVNVIDRCNLTILNELEHYDLAKFLAKNKVEIIASLPCYSEENVDSQRGKGVFNGSILGLKKLNKLGYGKSDSNLKLSLVYNPLGPYLPPDQTKLEIDYKKRLGEIGIEFSNLFTIANMPIKRFGSMLLSKGQFADYLALLKASYKADNLTSVMCRNLISVDWEGFVYDCDFNQMLNMPLKEGGRRMHVSELNIDKLINKTIAVADHCFGCTAGQGSSCGGALN